MATTLVFFSCYRSHRDLHSFPTRRSSDLHNAEAAFASRMKRRKRSGWLATSEGRILSATDRSSDVSCARNTSPMPPDPSQDRKSTRLNSSHANISYAVFCLKKKKKKNNKL